MQHTDDNIDDFGSVHYDLIKELLWNGSGEKEWLESCFFRNRKRFGSIVYRGMNLVNIFFSPDLSVPTVYVSLLTKRMISVQHILSKANKR